MIRMPADPFRGPLPPLSEEERQLERLLRRHVEQLAGVIGERNLFRLPQLTAAAEYVRSVLNGCDLTVQSYRYTVAGRACENIDAAIAGTRRPREIIVVGAHYDSVEGCPGANDNATGVAAALVLAERLAQSAPARTIRLVWFANEEPPFFQTEHMGSRVYAKLCRRRQDDIRLMLSLETIGYYSDAPGSQRYPFPFRFFYPSTGNFLAFVSNRDCASWVERVLRSFRRHAAFPSQGGALLDWIPGVGWSDHWAFWQEGYPAVMVTDTAPNRYPYYHTAEDTPDRVHYDKLARVTAGLRSVILDAANH